MGSMDEPFLWTVVTRVVLFRSHRAPGIPPEFYQWREEGNMRNYGIKNGRV